MSEWDKLTGAEEETKEIAYDGLSLSWDGKTLLKWGKKVGELA